MEKDIETNLKSELSRVRDKTNIETEARLGRFSSDGKFFPGVSKHYFYDMEKTLNRLIPKQYTHEKESVAIYFTEGLRSEVFTNGHIENMKKRKITNDIDMDIPKHYSMRISTSKETPYNNPILNSTVKKILKTKTIPQLLVQGTLFKFKNKCTLIHKGKQRNSNEGWNDLTWRYANPDWLMTVDRTKKRLKETSHFTQQDWVEMISMAGVIKGTPVPVAKYTVKCHILNLIPLTSLGNASCTQTFAPTSWRSKKRTSYKLWPGFNIDMTETVYSNQTIQHCYDGRGKKSYEIEADWDLKCKNVQEFAKVIKHVLYSIS